jgi:hypothetical protein
VPIIFWLWIKGAGVPQTRLGATQQTV